MSETPHKNLFADTQFKTPIMYRSESDESVASSNSDNVESLGTQSSNGEISLVAEFDDLRRHYRLLRDSLFQTESTFINFVEQVKDLYENYFQAIDECKRLQSLLDSKIHECSDLDHKLLKARKLLDLEKQNTRMVRKERDDLAHQISLVQELLFQDKGTSNRLSADEMRRKLSFLHTSNIQSDFDMNSNINNGCHQPQLSAIKEVNSTGSILSDFSYSRSEDDLDTSSLQKGKSWKKHRPSTGGVAEPAPKKRRSSGRKTVEIGESDTVRATTTLTVSKNGPITATSIIESVPKTPGQAESVTTNGETCLNAPPSNLVFESWARGSPLSSERRIHRREHTYQPKIIVMPETCGVCEKRIRFGKTSLKCKECRAVCHPECKDNVPLPCIPSVNTPNQGNGLGAIGDYTPTSPPMVPAILIHCINEIELRGLTEVGIYRVPGPERDVKALKERFLKGKGAPCINQIDVHVLCGTVKDFLRSLSEPLVTNNMKKKIIQACEAKDSIDIQPALYQIISELPQPNRDTLAYLLLHLQKVAESKECKMDNVNLAKVFGPTVVGLCTEQLTPQSAMKEVMQNINVTQQLLNLPSEYWASFVNVERSYQPSKLQQTPSTDSLLRPIASKGLFTPVNNRNLNLSKKKQKYFPSPKSMY